MADHPRLLYLITEDWYFWSHRLDLARAAREAGYDVIVATRVTDHGERIRGEGFQLEPLEMVRRSRNPFREVIAVAELVRLYRRVKPDVVHHVAMKPILYGSLAAWLPSPVCHQRIRRSWVCLYGRTERAVALVREDVIENRTPCEPFSHTGPKSR